MLSEEFLVDLSFDLDEITEERGTLSSPPQPTTVQGTMPVPAPPHSPHPDKLLELTRIVAPNDPFAFNCNHVAVDTLLHSAMMKELQKKIGLANTKLAAGSRWVQSREGFNRLVVKHRDCIGQISKWTKKQVVAKASASHRMSKDGKEKLQFAVHKRFSVWSTRLDDVVRNPLAWEQRCFLWDALVEANRHSFSAYNLIQSLIQ